MLGIFQNTQLYTSLAIPMYQHNSQNYDPYVLGCYSDILLLTKENDIFKTGWAFFSSLDSTKNRAAILCKESKNF